MDGCCFLLPLGMFLSAGAFTFGYAVLKPFIAASRKCGPTARAGQFLLSDLLWLMMSCHLPLAFVAAARYGRSEDSVVIAVVALVLMAIVFYVWFRGVMALSKLGVDRPIRRGVFLVLVLPLAVVGSLLTAVLILAVIVLLAIERQDNTWLIWWLAAAATLASACVGGRSLAHWVIAGAAANAPPPDDRPSALAQPHQHPPVA